MAMKLKQFSINQVFRQLRVLPKNISIVRKMALNNINLATVKNPYEVTKFIMVILILEL
jgi:hypothetical protein